MDSNLRDLVLEQMQKIVSEGGKRKKGGAKESQLKEIYEEYKNKFVDDGTLEFEKLRAQIIRQIAGELFEDTSVQAIKAVPQATINKVMANLKKGEDLRIKQLKKQDTEAEKYVRFFKNKKQILDYKQNIDEVKKNVGLQKPYEQFEYDEFGRPFRPDNAIVKADPKPKYASFNEETAKELTQSFKGQGTKRPLTAYNKFVKAYFKKHKGATMEDAGRAYRNK